MGDCSWLFWFLKNMSVLPALLALLSSVCAHDLRFGGEQCTCSAMDLTCLLGHGGCAHFLVFYRIWAKLTEWIVFVIMYV